MKKVILLSLCLFASIASASKIESYRGVLDTATSTYSFKGPAAHALFSNSNATDAGVTIKDGFKYTKKQYKNVVCSYRELDKSASVGTTVKDVAVDHAWNYISEDDFYACEIPL